MIKLRFLIVTTQDWVEEKIPDVKELMERSSDIDVSFDVQMKDDLKPEVVNERITEQWFQENITQYAHLRGYDGAIVLLSSSEGRTLKLKDGLRGSHFNDSDGFGEMWVVSDESSIIKFKDGSYRNKATKVIAHEIGHFLKYSGYTDLEIHDYDFQKSINNIEGFYSALRVRPSQTTVLTLLKRVLPYLYQLVIATGASRPLPDYIWESPTQRYLNPNPIYKKTGVHVGVDFPAPLHTPIKAPYSGEIVDSGYSDALGYWCSFKIGSNFMVCLHLREGVSRGKRVKGETIGYVGATGDIDGIHSHLEWWVVPMDRSLLTSKEKVIEYTSNILDVIK